MQSSYKTSRLSLDKLTLDDSEFILGLVNTPEWIRFIGERNVKNSEEAKEYVRRIMDNPAVTYWVVKTNNQQIPVGIITFIKRNYLDHHDVGFAFLPEHGKKGYAYEAADAVLNSLMKNPLHQTILATTIKENVNSIRLLRKLGFTIDKEIANSDETLSVYFVTADKLSIDRLVKLFFNIFNNKNSSPDLDLIYDICLPETLIIKKSKMDGLDVYDLRSFIEPRKLILSDGTLKQFEEHETDSETMITGNIAQRSSKYQKSGYLNANHFLETGNKFFQFIKTRDGWKISSVLWEDD
jgi:RimJ/RimL family protein N-acetyltransferase